MIAGHLHNSRCMWIRTLGLKQGIPVPRSVDRRRVAPRELVPALQRGSRDILQLLTLACDQGGSIIAPSTYIWRNLPSRGRHPGLGAGRGSPWGGRRWSGRFS